MTALGRVIELSESPVSTKYVQFNEGLLKYEMVHLPSSLDISFPIGQLETYYRHAVISATMLDSGKPAFCTQCWEEIALKDLYLSVHNATMPLRNRRPLS